MFAIFTLLWFHSCCPSRINDHLQYFGRKKHFLAIFSENMQ